MDLVGVLEQQVGRTGKLVAGVSPDQLSASTPCPGFDVRTLLNHIVGGQLLMARAAAGETTSRSDMPDVIGDDPAGAYERSSK
ncbi:MAG: maleylpyruvate isomerase N-terminal domain-containing protein, partial [Actinomycetota bacterium]